MCADVEEPLCLCDLEEPIKIMIKVMVLVYSNANKKQNEGSLLIFFKIYFHGFRTAKIVGRTISWKNTFYTNCGEKILTLLLDKSVK